MELSGKKLRAARVGKVWSQQDLADRAGTTEATVNRLEQGKQRARFVTIRKLATALEVDPVTLLAGVEEEVSEVTLQTGYWVVVKPLVAGINVEYDEDGPAWHEGLAIRHAESMTEEFFGGDDVTWSKALGNMQYEVGRIFEDGSHSDPLVSIRVEGRDVDPSEYEDEDAAG